LAVRILDFYHASERIANLVRALHPGDAEAFATWQETWCHQLKHQRGAALLASVGGARQERLECGATRVLSRAGAVSAEQRPPHGLPHLLETGLDHRLRLRRGRLQTGGGETLEGHRHALARVAPATASVTCAPCSSASPANGKPSGTEPLRNSPTNVKPTQGRPTAAMNNPG
jgi:hypothetical protein